MPVQPRPLPALLSQALIASTLEFDNEFERRMSEAGFRGIGLSRVVWAQLFRFIPDEGVAAGELARMATGGPERTLSLLGCLERWRFIHLEPDGPDAPPAQRLHPRTGQIVRDGFGSGRGIRQAWIVRPTSKGSAARE